MKPLRRAATEHIELGRVEREQQVEATHERAEPLREVEAEAIPVEVKAEEEEETGARKRGRRRSRRGRTTKGKAEPAPEEREHYSNRGRTDRYAIRSGRPYRLNGLATMKSAR